MANKANIKSVYWLENATQAYANLEKNITADVIIVGGGMTGLAAACQMKSLGATVVVLEEDILASGATGRNAGFLLSGTVEHYSRAVAIIGREKAKRLWAFSRNTVAEIASISREFDITCDLDINGSLHAAMDAQEDAEIKEDIRLMQEDGFRTEYVNSSDINKRIHGQNFVSGQITDSDGGFHPREFIAGLAERVHEKGQLDIFEKTRVLDIESTSFDSISVKTEKGTVSGHLVLLALNAYSQQLAPFLQDKILPVRGHVIVTSPIKRTLWNETIYANFGYEYFRQLQNGRIIMGGMRETVPGGDGLHFDESALPKVVTQLEQFLSKHFLGDEKFQIEYSWGGMMGFSRDGLPIIGALPSMKNAFVAGGYTGHGMGFAWSIGKLAADVMLEGSQENMDMFSMHRLVK
jgi:gamma-glutamylputrescine oxidase